MEWTDERMGDMADRMDAGFERVDGEIRDLRVELKEAREQMHDEFGSVRTEMRDESKNVRSEMRDEFKNVRSEMQEGFKDVRSEMQFGLARVHDEVAELRSMMFRFGITMIATMGALIGTLMAAIVTGTFIS
jgi:ElaB/YqjD/DUF883 family membrane-anchored ribosome-binding protein